jgi:hypothetical protein
VAADRKEKYWGEEHNAKRRDQYNTDPERAAVVRQQRRESYARKVGKAPAVSCLAHVGKVTTSGSIMAVQLGEKPPFVIGRVFTQTDVAGLLDRQAQVIYRWHQRAIFPSPMLFDDLGNRFYADAEVTDFIKILGEHQLVTPHYRADHTDVTARLFAASFQGNPARAQNWINERK